MAIVVEEERQSRGGIITVLIWLVILSIIAAAVYYIFFTKAELIEVRAPSNFRNTEALSKVNLNTESLINSESFRSLKQHISPKTQLPAGRSNPFLGF